MLDLGGLLTGLLGALPGGVNPERVYARTVLGGSERYFLVHVDPSALAPIPGVSGLLVNKIDITGDGNADLEIRATPTLAPSPGGVGVTAATIEIKKLTPNPLTGLVLDIGVRLDGAIAPPDGDASHEYVVIGLDAGTQAFATRVQIDARFSTTGTTGAVGSTSTTEVTMHTDFGGASAAADHPVLLRLHSHTGARMTRQATVVTPTTPLGQIIDLEDLGLGDIPILGGGGGGGGGLGHTDITVPNEAGPVTKHLLASGQLRRPGLRPHLDAAGAQLSWLQEIRAVNAAGEQTTRNRVEWRAPYGVTLVLAAEDTVAQRRSVIQTASLPGQMNLDYDPLRADARVPNLQYDAGGVLNWLEVRDEQNGSAERLRHLNVHLESLPRSIGFRLEAGEDKPLRVVVSNHANVETAMPQPLGAAAVILGRETSQLPAVPAGGLPPAVDVAPQTVAAHIDDVPLGYAGVLPRIYTSMRGLVFARIEENTPAPQPVHATDEAGLLVELRLAPDAATHGPEHAYMTDARSLRLHMFSKKTPEPGEPDEPPTRLLVRAGELPEHAIVDLKSLPETAPEGEYFGMRVWGGAGWVHALYLANAEHPQAVTGPEGRLVVALPTAPVGHADVRSDRSGLFVEASEPVTAEVAYEKPDGIDEDHLLTRVMAQLRVPSSGGLPRVADGLEIRGGGTSGRVALTGAGDPLAVRATPQVFFQQHRFADGATRRMRLEALTARVLGVQHVRQGLPLPDQETVENVLNLRVELDADRRNRALRVHQRERVPADAAPRSALKVRVADVPETLALVTREGPGRGAEDMVPVRSKVSQMRFDLSRPSGTLVLFSEPRQEPHDGPRAGLDAFAGIGVMWATIDAVPRHLVVTPLQDSRYVPADETRPRNFSEIPSDWTRDGLKFQTSDSVAVREMLQATWDRDSSSTTPTAWGLTYIRNLVLTTSSVPEGEQLREFWLWNPARRPASGGSFAKPDAVLGFRAGSDITATLDLDKYEQITSEMTPHWDALPASWPALAEVQLDGYGGEVSVGEVFGTLDPTTGGGGPGRWWVRSVGAWPLGGSVAIGNTGGPPLHKSRIFP